WPLSTPPHTWTAQSGRSTSAALAAGWLTWTTPRHILCDDRAYWGGRRDAEAVADRTRPRATRGGGALDVVSIGLHGVWWPRTHDAPDRHRATPGRPPRRTREPGRSDRARPIRPRRAVRRRGRVAGPYRRSARCPACAPLPACPGGFDRVAHRSPTRPRELTGSSRPPLPG